MDSTINYMSPDDLEKVIQHIPDLGIRKWKDRDVEFLFRILYWTALRPSEGIKLKKEDIRLNDKKMILWNTKTKKYDEANIAADFIPELSRYLDSKGDGRLLDKLVYDTFYRWVIRLGKMCNIEAWTTPQYKTGEKTKGHIFRKSLGKDMIEGTHGRKFSYDVVSKQLRHAKPSTTIDSYLKASLSRVKEAWE